MILLLTVNKEYVCNVTFIDVIRKVISSKVFISIVIVFDSLLGKISAQTVAIMT